jgi:hypothetical protein
MVCRCVVSPAGPPMPNGPAMVGADPCGREPKADIGLCATMYFQCVEAACCLIPPLRGDHIRQ